MLSLTLSALRGTLRQCTRAPALPYLHKQSISYSSAYLFADDVKSLSSLESTHLQMDLDSISHWSDEWKIKLNALKSSQYTFPMSHYHVNDSIIHHLVLL